MPKVIEAEQPAIEFQAENKAPTAELLPKEQPVTALEQRPTTPMDLLSLALSHGSGIDVIERLSALQERAQDRDAEMQFNEAMNAVQSEIGRVAPDATNTNTKSRWATFAKLDKFLRPIYTKHGFSLSFDSGDSPLPLTVRVLCYVSHRAGHTRTYTSPPVPADGKGPKGGDVMTPQHATGGAMSYGSRYLLKFIFNIAVGEDDTDGNPPGTADKGWLQSQVDEIGRCETLEGLQDAFTAAANKALNEIRDINAYDALKNAKESRKKELSRGN